MIGIEKVLNLLKKTLDYMESGSIEVLIESDWNLKNLTRMT